MIISRSVYTKILCIVCIENYMLLSKLDKCFIYNIYVGFVGCGFTLNFHNNSDNTSTKWEQHVSDKSTHLINKSTQLI